MPRNTGRYYLLNWAFVLGLLLLLLNDHVWKLHYANWLTGKLSDFLGMLLVPMLLSFFFPRHLKLPLVLTALGFIFWKSPASQGMIDFYNHYALIPITRVVDYTDLLALLLLPFSYLFLKQVPSCTRLQIKAARLKPTALLLLSALIFMATSPPAYYKYTHSNGELRCHKCMQMVNYSQSEVIALLSENNYSIALDSLPQEHSYRFEWAWQDSTKHLVSDYPFYKIDTLIMENDTITSLQLALQKVSEHKTAIWVNAMDVPDSIPNFKAERKLRKYYRERIYEHLQQCLGKQHP